jgi:aspartyl aminopeptidase
VVRGDGSLVAFELGTDAPAEAGLRIVGAHTDSPNLRINPSPDRTACGVRQLTVETYGGVLLHTWFDRDCSIAGRARVRAAGEEPRTVRVDLRRPLARIADVAIHLQREVRQDGFKPNAELHLHPLVGLEDARDLQTLLLDHLHEQGEAADAVLGYDLMLYDVHPAQLGGIDDAFVYAARLDNLGSCHAGLAALLAPHDGPLPAFTRVLALWDHEEVGSRSSRGADSTFLRDVVSRVAGGGEALRRAASRSSLISADMAHGVHPNYVDRHAPEHMPQLGGGPVVKWNVNQRYTTDGMSAAMFAEACERVGVVPQHFKTRNDMACGSTIGPISAGLLGVPTVDVGNPMLAMHSCREMCASADVPAMIQVMRAYYETL